MKKIEAVILPSKLDAVQAELERRGIHAALTLTEVQQADGHRGSISPEKEPAGSLKDRLKVELIVGDRLAQNVMGVIMEYAQVAANEASGHVALLSVTEALQIVPPFSNNL
jgi:nitrogen regulatory protein PII